MSKRLTFAIFFLDSTLRLLLDVIFMINMKRLSASGTWRLLLTSSLLMITMMTKTSAVKSYRQVSNKSHIKVAFIYLLFISTALLQGSQRKNVHGWTFRCLLCFWKEKIGCVGFPSLKYERVHDLDSVVHFLLRACSIMHSLLKTELCEDEIQINVLINGFISQSLVLNCLLLWTLILLHSCVMLCWTF